MNERSSSEPSSLRMVGLAGSLNRPSKTYAVVEHLVHSAANRYGFSSSIFDLNDVGPSLGRAVGRDHLDATAENVIGEMRNADALVIGTPTFKGSYPGLFKHLIDLLDPIELRAKPVVIAATGGGDRHALMVEHQLRPLFGFFAAHTMPTAIYASDRDFRGYEIASEPLISRMNDAVGDLSRFFDCATPHASLGASRPRLKGASPGS